MAGLGTSPNDWKDLGLSDRVSQILNRTDLNPNFVQQISQTLQVLNEARKNGKLNVQENQNAFIKLVSDLGSPDFDTVKERFAELEHAASVLGRADIDPNTPVVIGAEFNQQLTNLPRIDVENVEADTYFKTVDGVIHINEVKNTPNAFVDKLKKQQFDRYGTWIEQGKNFSSPQKRAVEVYIRETEPGFDQILDIARLQRLSDTIVSDENNPFLKVGEYMFSLKDLKDMEQDAIQKLEELISENQINGIQVKPIELAKQYFGSLSATFQTLKKTYGNKV